MTHWLYAGAASLALVAAGLVHGFWTDRWIASSELQEAAQRLAEIPYEIGDWKGSDLDLKPGQSGSGVTGGIQRAYKNQKTGAQVSLALLNGRPGPVSIHTPDVCYGASGYKVNRRTMVHLDKNEDSAQFWKADMVKVNVTSESRLRIYWGWNGGKGWQAPADARQSYPRHNYPVLHKLYVLRDLTTDQGKLSGSEPCEDFLRALLPVLDGVLFSAGGPDS